MNGKIKILFTSVMCIVFLSMGLFVLLDHTYLNNVDPVNKKILGTLLLLYSILKATRVYNIYIANKTYNFDD